MVFYISACNRPTQEINETGQNNFIKLLDLEKSITNLPDSTNHISLDSLEYLKEAFTSESDTFNSVLLKISKLESNAYLFLIKNELNKLDDLSWGIDDYFNRLEYIEGVFFEANEKYINTPTGLIIKNKWDLFSLEKESLERMGEAFRTTFGILSNKRKNELVSEEEFNYLSGIQNEFPNNFFSDKIIYHLNSYLLALETFKLTEFEFETIKQLNKELEEFKEIAKINPVNDSVKNESINIVKVLNEQRKEILATELSLEILDLQDRIKYSFLKKHKLKVYSSDDVLIEPTINKQSIANEIVYIVSIMERDSLIRADLPLNKVKLQVNKSDRKGVETNFLFIEYNKDYNSGDLKY